MKIQLHHPLQVTQKQTVTEKEIQQQDLEVCVSLCSINPDVVMDMCTDHGGPVRGGLYLPRLNFKRFHVAISEGSHVAVGISSESH